MQEDVRHYETTVALRAQYTAAVLHGACNAKCILFLFLGENRGALKFLLFLFCIFAGLHLCICVVSICPYCFVFYVFMYAAL